MTEHSIFSPSRFNHLVKCPGSWKLEQLFPNEENEWSLEGKEAHEFASEELKFFKENDKEIRIKETKYKIGSNEHVNIYTEEVLNTVGKNIEDIHIEEKINIPYLHAECFGTPDAWYYDKEKNELHVWDFKYGFKPVEVEQNWQLIAYAYGISCKLYDENKKYRFDVVNDLKLMGLVVNLHIAQPRARHKDGSIRTWSLSSTSLMEYGSALKERIDNAQLDTPEFNVGAHCQYCKARTICETFKKKCEEIRRKVL